LVTTGQKVNRLTNQEPAKQTPLTMAVRENSRAAQRAKKEKASKKGQK
jgi:hypothetical protein